MSFRAGLLQFVESLLLRPSMMGRTTGDRRHTLGCLGAADLATFGSIGDTVAGHHRTNFSDVRAGDVR